MNSQRHPRGKHGDSCAPYREATDCAQIRSGAEAAVFIEGFQCASKGNDSPSTCAPHTGKPCAPKPSHIDLTSSLRLVRLGHGANTTFPQRRSSGRESAPSKHRPQNNELIRNSCDIFIAPIAHHENPALIQAEGRGLPVGTNRRLTERIGVQYKKLQSEVAASLAQNLEFG